MTKILVTGATGNIGYDVVKQLSQRGVTTLAAVSNLSKSELFRKMENVKPVLFNFLDEKTYEEALDGIKKVFLVRPPQLANPKEDMLPFLQCAKKKGVEHIVFVSLLGVEKNPVVPHRKIETFIRESGFTYTFLRPSFFMQNLNTTHRDDIALRDELFIPVGNAKTSFIDARDIGEAAAVCLTERQHENKAYTLTGSEAITYEEVARILTNVLERPIVYTNPSFFQFRKLTIKRGTPKAFANVMTMLYVMTWIGTAKDVTNELETIIGRPPTTFEQYAKDYQSYFKR